MSKKISELPSSAYKAGLIIPAVDQTQAVSAQNVSFDISVLSPTGPTGPAGATGPTGATGGTGPTGTISTNATAMTVNAASDAGGAVSFAGTASLTDVIHSANDYAASLSQTIASLQQTIVGTAPTWTTASGSLGSVIETLTFTATVAASTTMGRVLNYYVASGSLPSGLTLNAATGVISGTASSVSSDTTSNFTLGVSDGISAVTRAFSITVRHDVAPTWTTSTGSLGSPLESTSFSATVSATTTMGRSLSYSVTAGSLPSGLTLASSTGVISGTTPTAASDTTSNFTITVSDGIGSTARAFSITVKHHLAPTWSTASGSLGNPDINSSFSATVVATSAHSLSITYSVTSGALPSGLSLNSSTGVISGTTTSTTGTASFTITASDGTLTTPQAFTIKVGITVTDPNYSSVSLLLHMEGTNGGTTFTDQKGHTVTPSSTTISTAQAVAGSSSALLASGGYLSVADATDLRFGNGDFTIEFSVYPSSTVTSGRTLMFDKGNGQDWQVDNGYPGTGISFLVKNSGVASANGTSFPANTWTKVAVSRTGTTVRIFMNGTQVASGTIGAITDTAAPITIGSLGGSFGFPAGTYIDEVRITKGVGRYTANYTPNATGTAFPDA